MVLVLKDELQTKMHVDYQYSYERESTTGKLEDDRISGIHVLKADIGSKNVSFCW